MARNKTPPFMKKGTDKRFLMLYTSLLSSESYLKLSNGAKVLLIDMLSLYNPKKVIEGYDTNEYFKYSRSMANSKNITKNPNSYNSYVSELITAGFIEKISSGKYTRTENVYKYSDKWQEL